MFILVEKFIVLAFAATVAAFLFTQVIIPILFGGPLFPLFRKRVAIEQKIVEAEEESEVIDLEARLAATEAANEAKKEALAEQEITPSPAQPSEKKTVSKKTPTKAKSKAKASSKKSGSKKGKK